MTRRTQLLLGLLGLLPCLACFSPSEGERAASGTCPEGETCSTTTSGLFFVGTFDAGDDGPRHVGTLVIGGTENVQLRTGMDRLTATAFTGSFVAVSDTPSVMTVDSSAGGTIVVRGVSEGSALLRIVEPGTDHLLDRVSITVLRSDGPAIVESSLADLAPRDGLLAQRYAGPFSMLAGMDSDVTLSLERVTDCGTDTGLRVTDAHGATLVSGIDGAPYRFTLHHTSEPSIELTMHVAGEDQHLSIPIAAGVEAVRVEAHVQHDAFDASRVLSTYVCAVGTAHDLPLLGSGAPTFTITSGTLTTSGTGGHCVGFTLPAGEHATVTATVDGVSGSLDVVGAATR